MFCFYFFMLEMPVFRKFPDFRKFCSIHLIQFKNKRMCIFRTFWPNPLAYICFIYWNRVTSQVLLQDNSHQSSFYKWTNKWGSRNCALRLWYSASWHFVILHMSGLKFIIKVKLIGMNNLLYKYLPYKLDNE